MDMPGREQNEDRDSGIARSGNGSSCINPLDSKNIQECSSLRRLDVIKRFFLCQNVTVLVFVMCKH